jgi:hypothetical protein
VNKLLKITLIFFGIILVLFASLGIYMYANRPSFEKFRTTQDQLQNGEGLDLRGLETLHASGSAPPLFEELQQKLSFVKGKKIICDLKDANHIYFKGIPAKFFGFQSPQPQIREIFRRFLYAGAYTLPENQLRSEEEEAKIYGFDYIQLPIGSRSGTPSKDVDRFVSFIDNLPQDTWVHFHCHRGKGRTSMALVMLDIMKNAPHVSLEDIRKRQHRLGSVDLFDVSFWVNGTYSKEMLEKRKHFIEEFYTFICQRKAGGQQTWSAWKGES